MAEKHSAERSNVEYEVRVWGKASYDLGILVSIWKLSQNFGFWWSSNGSFR